MKKAVMIFLTVVLCVSLFGCGHGQTDDSLWDSALYTEDATLGSGAKKLTVRVVTEEKSVTLTLHTDADTVGEALMEHRLVFGEQTMYGLYIKAVNGMTADYNKTQTYWSFEQNGEQMPTGVDGAVFQDGDCFELVHTK